MLQNDAGGRPAAASKFNIGIDVLVKVSDLAATKGGREGRKAKGVGAEFSTEERVWLEEATKAMIARAGEKAASPTATLPQITMADLPR
jgi:hypothetical protein